MKIATPGRSFLRCCVPCVLLSFFLFAYPPYVIRPFRAQGARELIVALAITRYRTLLMAALAAIALWALVRYWRRERRWLRRSASAVASLAIAAMALASRVNIYELMFHPLGPPSFQAAAEGKLDGDEMVIAVRVGQVARAYPIRNISYYHVVNDLVDGVPIAATY
jgi:amino acid transporter